MTVPASANPNLATRPKALWVNGNYWDAPIRIGAHYYARCLAEAGWDVAFVSDPISPLHLVHLPSRDRWRMTVDRYRTWRAGGRQDLDGRLFYYSPMTLLPTGNFPIFRSRWMLNHWHQFTIPDVRRLLKHKGFGRVDLLMIDSVAQGFWIDAVAPRRIVLRIADLLAGFAAATPALLEREATLIRRVDHVIYTAVNLAPGIAAAGAKAMTHVPNGALVEHFIQGSNAVPPEYARIPSPRIVYAGALQEWFDQELVAALAQALPQASVVIIGPQTMPLPRLKGISNIHLLGARPFRDLPMYLKNVDVGIIPFIPGPLIHSVNPIKLYEYLACGLPVVATAWKELQSLQSPAVLCSDAAGFMDAVRQVLSNPGDPAPRQAYARQADWRHRFARMAQAIDLDNLARSAAQVYS